MKRFSFFFAFLLTGSFALLVCFTIVLSVENVLSKMPLGADGFQVNTNQGGNVTLEEKKHGEDSMYSDIILKRNLFRAKLNIEMPKQKSEKEIEEEMLANTVKDMTLKGVVLGKNTESFAVIDKGQNRGVWAYAVGEIVDKGLCIDKIESNEVTLKKDEFSFKLRLFAKGFEKRTTSPTSISEKKTQQDAGKIPQNAIRREGNRIVIDRNFAERARTDQNLINSITASVAIKTSLDAKGNPDGFKIVSIDKGTIIEKIGLMPNDVVQEVNGFRLTNNEEATKVYEALKDAKRFEVKILRNGRPRVLYYEIR